MSPPNRGDLYREWLALGSDAKQIAQAFTPGVNACVSLTRQHSDLMPLEFKLLDYEPAFWHPQDVVLIRSNGLLRNVTSEVLRSLVVFQYGLTVDALRSKLEPPWETSVPEGFDPCRIPEDVADVYLLAKSPVDFAH